MVSYSPSPRHGQTNRASHLRSVEIRKHPSQVLAFDPGYTDPTASARPAHGRNTPRNCADGRERDSRLEGRGRRRLKRTLVLCL